MPDIRTFLDLSTAHLPEQICDRLGAVPGVIAHETVYGWLMWVPDNPADPDERAEVPDVVATIQRFARAAGCTTSNPDVRITRIIWTPPLSRSSAANGYLAEASPQLRSG